MSPQCLRWAFLPSEPERASERVSNPETTRGAGRGRRLALLGEEIYVSACRSTNMPAETNAWEKPSISQRAQRALLFSVEHDRSFGTVEDVTHETVIAGLLADAIGATAAIDHEPWLCHHVAILGERCDTNL